MKIQTIITLILGIALVLVVVMDGKDVCEHVVMSVAPEYVTPNEGVGTSGVEGVLDGVGKFIASLAHAFLIGMCLFGVFAVLKIVGVTADLAERFGSWAALAVTFVNGLWTPKVAQPASILETPVGLDENGEPLTVAALISDLDSRIAMVEGKTAEMPAPKPATVEDENKQLRAELEALKAKVQKPLSALQALKDSARGDKPSE